MPPTHTDKGLLAAVRIRRTHAGVAVVVLSQYVHRRYATELLEQLDGGIGYMLKQRVADMRTFTADLRGVQAAARRWIPRSWRC